MKNTQLLCLTILFLFVNSITGNKISKNKHKSQLQSFSYAKNKNNLLSLFFAHEKVVQEVCKWTSINHTVASQANVLIYFPNDCASCRMTADKVKSLLGKIDANNLSRLRATDNIVVNCAAVFIVTLKGANDNRSTLKSNGLISHIFELTKRGEEYALVSGLDIMAPSGQSIKFIYGSVENDVVTLNESQAAGVVFSEMKQTSESGKTLEPSDKTYQSGLKLQYEGLLSNMNKKTDERVDYTKDEFKKDFTTINDTSSTKETVSSTIIKITIVISITSPEFYLTLQLNQKDDQGEMVIGKAAISTPRVLKDKSKSALNSATELLAKLEAVSSPNVIKCNAETKLSNMEYNKYFSNSCIKNLFTYAFDDVTKPVCIATPLGRGTALCNGNPLHEEVFLCSYPNNEIAPDESLDEFSLRLEETKSPRVATLVYDLFKGTKLYRVNSRKILYAGIRFKLINATGALLFQ